MTNEDQDSPNTVEHAYCAHCGTENPRDAYSCDRCGERITYPDPMKPPPMGLVECPRCVTPNESHASYCVNCGSDLADGARVTVFGGGAARGRQVPHSPPGGIRLRNREHQQDDADRRAVDDSSRWNDPDQARGKDSDRDAELQRLRAEATRARAADRQRQIEEENSRPNDSGSRTAKLPESARGWNTAAFLLSPLWGPANGVWLGIVGLLFLFIPIDLNLRLLMYFAFGAYMGIRGNEMAWRARRWPSLAHFRRVQQQWMLVALVVNLIALTVVVIVMSG